ncbi:hypothetical protein QBZ16_000911 [Prototheca wickerhamii]|uniref:Magnesium transporter n=1 Tax=Prototheca wickerhamii TaxID=3111 RepID=A0AAD9IDW6_PROWI|nr:hypothetical protein QBZ16_000911 [Prototheca wickerhamii]
METVPLMLRGRTGDPSVRRGAVSAQGGAFASVKQKPVILVDEDGHLSYTTLRKQALVTDMALRHRDIRSLEPQDPPAILVRKQAIVLNLEGLKLIIGRDKVLILSVPAPADLTARCPAELGSPIVQRLAAHIAMRDWDAFSSASEGASAPVPAPLGAHGGSYSAATLEEIRGGAALPYELRALESGLLCLVRVLEREVATLERATRPVLDRIRRGVVRSDLEELYESRTRLVRAIARVTRLKEILEELLDEPELLEGLCLTAADAVRARRGDGRQLAARRGRGLLRARGAGPAGGRRLGLAAAPASGAVAAAAADEAEREEIEECEDLVEAYWLQVDALLSRLALLQERIAATEHMVNLDLDSRRNQLVSLGLAIDLLLMAFECHMAITSIFGMNLESGLEPLQPYSLWGIVGLGVLVGGLLALLVARYCRRNGLLFLPSFGLAAGNGSVGTLATA